VGLEDAKAVLNSLVRVDVLRQEMVELGDGSATRAIRLNRSHQFVQQVLAEWHAQSAMATAGMTAGGEHEIGS
jgi:hypothetical protein